MLTIIDHPSPNHSARSKGVRVDTIVIHHTATPSTLAGFASALRTLTDGKATARVSAHYLISPEGAVWRLVPEDRTAWHAGVSCLPWETQEPKASVNGRSIGIELVNPGDGKTPFTEAQYQALEHLVPDIMRRLGWDCAQFLYGYTVNLLPGVRGKHGHILGHRDVAPGRKTDPADNFEWLRIRQALASRVA